MEMLASPCNNKLFLHRQDIFVQIVVDFGLGLAHGLNCCSNGLIDFWGLQHGQIVLGFLKFIPEVRIFFQEKVFALGLDISQDMPTEELVSGLGKKLGQRSTQARILIRYKD